MASPNSKWLSALAAAGGIAILWRMEKLRREAAEDRRAAAEERLAMENALLSAAHSLEFAGEQIMSDIRAGEISIPEGIDTFIHESVREIFGATNPKLSVFLFKGADPHWILFRRLVRVVTRLARQPCLPKQGAKYFDFITGDIQPETPPLQAGAKRFVVVSDTHMRHRDISIPDGDVLIHCGDILNGGGDPQPNDWHPNQSCFEDFLAWMVEQQKHCPEVIFVGGNHDTIFEELGTKRIQQQLPAKATYLSNSETCVTGGLRIYGTGFSYTQAAFKSGNMAFQSSDPHAILDSIPAGLDVLMTHGPPQLPSDPFNFKQPPWIKNKATDFGAYGCDELTRIVQDRVCPRVHIFGHLHEAHGAHRIGETLFVCGSSVSSHKTTADNPPIVFDLPLAR